MSLDSELIMRNGEVVGTQTPTGHSVLIDARFELPYGKYNTILTHFHRSFSRYLAEGRQNILLELCNVFEFDFRLTAPSMGIHGNPVWVSNKVLN